MKLITGLPRSRTYWMSQYFNCPHEPRLEDMEQGQLISDSSFFYRVREGMEQYDWVESVVVIERDVEAVKNSVRNWLPTSGIEYNKAWPASDMSYLDFSRGQLKLLPNKGFNVLYVDFNKVDDCLPAIATHLGVPYNKGTHAKLAEKKLSRHFGKDYTGFQEFLSGFGVYE